MIRNWYNQIPYPVCYVKSWPDTPNSTQEFNYTRHLSIFNHATRMIYLLNLNPWGHNMTTNSVLFHIYIMNFVFRYIYHLAYQSELPKNWQKLELVSMIYLLNEVDISDRKFHEKNENATFVQWPIKFSDSILLLSVTLCVSRMWPRRPLPALRCLNKLKKRRFP